jgi:Flp pilus assembly protein protease CpaA
MIADILISLTALVVLTIASYTDIKTTEIPDYLSYSLIFIALAIRLIYAFLFNEPNYFAFGLLGLALMSVIGNIMYYTKQWGGGDAKLLMGLGATFGTTPSFINIGIPFLLIVFINIIFFGAIYGIIWAIYLAIKNNKKIGKEMKMLEKTESMQKGKKMVMISSLIFIIAIVFIEPIQIKLLAFIMLILSLFYSFSWTYMKAIEKVSLHKMIPISRLLPGDFVLDEKIRKRFKIPELGLEDKHIEALKVSKIKKVEIKQGIPFVPSIWIGVTASFLLSNFYAGLF